MKPVLKKFLAWNLCCLIFFSGGCTSLDRIAFSSTRSLMESGIISFSAETDPVLARDSIAGSLRFLESLHVKNPRDPKTQVLLARALFSYIFGYVEDSDPLRAVHLYKRGFEVAVKSLGGKDFFLRSTSNEFENLLKKRIHSLHENYFWAAIHYACWIRLDKSDLEALGQIQKLKIIA